MHHNEAAVAALTVFSKVIYKWKFMNSFFHQHPSFNHGLEKSELKLRHI